MKITTPRLILISCDLDTFEALLESNQKLKSHLKVEVSPDWYGEFGIEPYRWSMGQLKKDPESKDWLTYLMLHKGDNIIIGTCGYKGKPDQQGVVEIGYGIIPAYRELGLTTEAAQALIDHAFAQEGIKIVRAHTLAEENASVKILRKCGMQFIKQITDPEDGEIWRWELERK